MKAMYVHVPFCDYICAYCDFCRVKKQSRLVEKWLITLQKEIKTRLVSHQYDTIYIGGGTPSCLTVDELRILFRALAPYQIHTIEYTIEVNPESLTAEKCALFREFGINRVSIGVQTTCDRLLSLIGRKHSKKEVESCITMLKEVGIVNVSCDCMYSLPTQTLGELKETLDFFIEIAVPHVSIYSLTIEPNSQFKRLGYVPLDEDTEADYYQFILSYLDLHGYRQYEISNFCKTGYESRHNIHYWQYDDFVGLSMGASGKENHQRYECTKNFETYFNEDYIEEVIDLSRADECFEFVMMGLRLKQGLNKKIFKARFMMDFDHLYLQEKTQLINQGLLQETNEYIACTEKGYPILNEVLEVFIK